MTLVRHRVGTILAFGAIAAVIAIADALLQTERLGPNLLLAGVYLAGLAVGALFFTAMQKVTGATWSDSLRPIAATLPSTLPIATVLLLLVFVTHPETYSWTVVQHSGLRGAWLFRPFFIARSGLYLGLWMLSARLLTRPAASSRDAAGVLAVLALTGWLAASDWLMSLTPQWTSTIFSVYVFVGFVVSAVAAMLLTCIWVRVRNPTCRSVSEGQLRDLATMLLGFSCLWAYLWYCQYMLIWYTNQSHETGYYVVRTGDGWHLLFYATVVLKWALPFVLLLGKAGKRRLEVLALAAFSVLVGHWIDLYVMIFPDVAEVRVWPGLLETGMALGLGAACAWVLRNCVPLENRTMAGVDRRISAP
jgi:Ni/Fe-hydrogenase subunit HybB-like protein